MTDKPAPASKNPIAATRYWLEHAVIGLNFCPFARAVFSDEKMRIVDCAASAEQNIIEALLGEVAILEEHEEVATSLLVLSAAADDFYDFLDLVDACNRVLIEEGYEGVYQLAHFHPQYCFADEEEADASHYTNRSPYPVLHLLRESLIDEALEHYADPEAIPGRNITVARERGADFFKQLLQRAQQASERKD